MNYGPTASVATPQPLYARYVHGMKTIDFIPDGTTDYGGGAGKGVPFGAVLVIGSLIGIANVPIDPLTKGALCIEGVFEFPKSNSDAGLTSGAMAWWDATNHIASSTVGVGVLLGKVEPPGTINTDTLVKIRVDPLANNTFGPIPSTAVAATGSTVANAAALSYGFNLVTAGDGTKGVVLPTAPPVNQPVIVKNNSGSVLKVWPDAAATINAIGSNANIALAANTIAIFYPTSATQWWSLPLLPS